MSPTKMASKKANKGARKMGKMEAVMSENNVYRNNSAPVVLHRNDPLVRALASRGIRVDVLTTYVRGTVHDAGCNALKEPLTDENARTWCTCHPTVAISRRPNPFDGLEPRNPWEA